MQAGGKRVSDFCHVSPVWKKQKQIGTGRWTKKRSFSKESEAFHSIVLYCFLPANWWWCSRFKRFGISKCEFGQRQAKNLDTASRLDNQTDICPVTSCSKNTPHPGMKSSVKLPLPLLLYRLSLINTSHIQDSQTPVNVQKKQANKRGRWEGEIEHRA